MNIRLALAYQRRILGQTCLGSRNMVTASRFLFEKKIVRVPSMGDSITEGTIVEWSKKVGQYVKSDDIIASIETDKVTVEIRAEESGVITQRFVEM
jgi:2-oxoglutarate dehydrogenase E2 component (dihydrolipoamide succinyltransferase)